MARHVSKEELTSALTKSLSMSDVIKLIGLPYNGKSAKRLNELFRLYEMDTTSLSPGAKAKLRTKYPIVKKTCPMCEKSFETRSGHPKEATCCSRKCSNKFFAKPLTTEHRLKIQNGVRKSVGYNDDVPRDKSRHRLKHTNVCEWCLKEYQTTNQTRRFCCNTCAATWRSKQPKIIEKIRKTVRKNVENGTHVGWKVRSTNIPSYPERFFIDVLDSRGITYERELPVGRWFIDFAIEDKKIALEIDGHQHERVERHALDVKKDAFLVSLGWKVYRIKWKSINTDSGKLYIKNEIDKFLEFYRNVA